MAAKNKNPVLETRLCDEEEGNKPADISSTPNNENADTTAVLKEWQQEFQQQLGVLRNNSKELHSSATADINLQHLCEECGCVHNDLSVQKEAVSQHLTELARNLKAHLETLPPSLI